MDAFADRARFERLYAIVSHLRAPGGCAWDREQTPESMCSSLVEEAYEVVDAIEQKDDSNLEEEIGDLFLVASAIMRMKEEQGHFGPDEVYASVCAKLVRRHPHIFGDAEVHTAEAVLEQWDRIKKAEKGAERSGSALDGVPRGYPPLERANELQHKAAKVGFDWDDAKGILAKLGEERRELEEALAGGGSAAVEEEIGDLLFTVVNLGRKLGVDPARALAATNRKFEARFREMERRIQAHGGTLSGMSLAEMDVVWEQVKQGGKPEPGFT
jgi:tetrapyrrole methylase family protein/MazG family protein